MQVTLVKMHALGDRLPASLPPVDEHYSNLTEVQFRAAVSYAKRMKGDVIVAKPGKCKQTRKYGSD